MVNFTVFASAFFSNVLLFVLSFISHVENAPQEEDFKCSGVLIQEF